jgi:hypothetical protein
MDSGREYDIGPPPAEIGTRRPVSNAQLRGLFVENWHRGVAVVSLCSMQPTHIDELLGGTWQWDRDDDEPHFDDLEQLDTMLDEMFVALVQA